MRRGAVAFARRFAAAALHPAPGLWFGPLMWAAYLVAPAPVGGIISGVPIGPVNACALLGLGWLVARGRPVPGERAIAAVLALSVIVSVGIEGQGGLRARYFANAEAEGSYEPGTEFPRGAHTRIDERLDFAPGAREFPLTFFNDISRFNFYRSDEPARDRLGFSVQWTGYIHVDRDSPAEAAVYLFAPKASGRMLFDGELVLAVSDGLHTAAPALAPGWHRLDVRFSSPEGAPRRFEAGLLNHGARRPFDASIVVTRPIPVWQMTVRHWTRAIRRVFDAGALVWLGWLVITAIRADTYALRSGGRLLAQPTPVLSLLALLGLADACRFAWPWANRLMLLGGGGDPMTYEFYARDILLNGPLMTLGQPVGQGGPFYYQALYPYFLALMHGVFGDGMFGVMLVQRLLVVVVVGTLVDIAVRLGGEGVWPVALAWAAVLTYLTLAPVAADLTNESLFVPLALVWVSSLLRVGPAPSRSGAVWAGLLGGVAALVRTTIVAAWPVAALTCWSAWRPPVRRTSFVVAMVACGVAVLSLITARNWVVARQFAPAPTEFGITLLGGNEPPADLVFDPGSRGPIYDRLGAADPTRRVLEYAINRPGSFIRNLARKALFALGIYEPYAPGWGWSPVHVAGALAALVGLWFAWRTSPLSPQFVVMPALIAFTQLLVIVIIYPKAERLILPFHMLMAPYGCLGIHWLWRWPRVSVGGATS